ncbi:ABC transporter permease [Streptomyces griseocarneus]|nr:ABC transporter permease [Streptomyces griseocarneus]
MTAPSVSNYVSPIPVRRATLADALASEWTKIRSLRSTMWTMGIMVLLVFGVGSLIAMAAGAAGDDVGNNASALGFAVFGVLLSIICVITLGVLTMSSEYNTGMIRTTLTACPNRGRVLAAKAIVFFLLVFVIMLVSTTLVAMVDTAMIRGNGLVETTGPMWLKATFGVSLYVALLGLLALAVGTLIRHSAGAIAAMLGLMLLPMIMAAFMVADSLTDLREFLLEYSIPTMLFTIYVTPSSGSGPEGWDAVFVMAGVAAVALGGAYAALRSRDA